MKKIHQKGYTLIEILIVIVIIGVLSTLALIYYGDSRAGARDVKRVHETREISDILTIVHQSSPGYVLQCGGSACAKGADVSTLSSNNNELDQIGSFVSGSYFIDYPGSNPVVEDVKIVFSLEKGTNMVPQGCNEIIYTSSTTPSSSTYCP